MDSTRSTCRSLFCFAHSFLPSRMPANVSNRILSHRLSHSTRQTSQPRKQIHSVIFSGNILFRRNLFSRRWEEISSIVKPIPKPKQSTPKSFFSISQCRNCMVHSDNYDYASVAASTLLECWWYLAVNTTIKINQSNYSHQVLLDSCYMFRFAFGTIFRKSHEIRRPLIELCWYGSILVALITIIYILSRVTW
jgi:hypothetical protein